MKGYETWSRDFLFISECELGYFPGIGLERWTIVVWPHSRYSIYRRRVWPGLATWYLLLKREVWEETFADKTEQSTVCVQRGTHPTGTKVSNFNIDVILLYKKFILWREAWSRISVSFKTVCTILDRDYKIKNEIHNYLSKIRFLMSRVHIMSP